jgi:hypothetical protein
MEFEAITEKVIGCAYQVYNRMGFGFLESVYEKCMASDSQDLDHVDPVILSINPYWPPYVVGYVESTH